MTRTCTAFSTNSSHKANKLVTTHIFCRSRSPYRTTYSYLLHGRSFVSLLVRWSKRRISVTNPSSTPILTLFWSLRGKTASMIYGTLIRPEDLCYSTPNSNLVSGHYHTRATSSHVIDWHVGLGKANCLPWVITNNNKNYVTSRV